MCFKCVENYKIQIFYRLSTKLLLFKVMFLYLKILLILKFPKSFGLAPLSSNNGLIQ